MRQGRVGATEGTLEGRDAKLGEGEPINHYRHKRTVTRLENDIHTRLDNRLLQS